MSKSKILVIGATGRIGKFIAIAGASSGHPTFAFVRPSTVESKSGLIASFKSTGITILQGSLHDHESLIAALKQVNVVISTVGGAELANQTKIVAAIKEVGHINRFFPSEFGTDVDRVKALGPAGTMFNTKAKIYRAVEEAGIPHTYVVSNAFFGAFVANLVQPGRTTPPRDKVIIHGSGDVKAISLSEQDIATFTIRAVDDLRTINKKLHMRPEENILTQNELVALWEKKIGKVIDKQHVTADEIVKQIETTSSPASIYYALLHVVFILAGQVSFELGPDDVEATSL